MALSNQTAPRADLQVITTFTREDSYHSIYFDQRVAYKQIAHRYLLKLKDGNTIESSVFQHFIEDEPADLSIDISTMVGCPMTCKFCEAASISYARSLTVDEITSQVVKLIDLHDSPRFLGIMCAYQGIGEPSLIAEKVSESAAYLLTLDPRIEISIATLGTRAAAFKVWRESGLPIGNLQISSSGTTEDQINWLMPRQTTLNELIEEAKQCAQSRNFKKIKFNYLLIQGFNDSEEDVERLMSFFQGTTIIVKIASLNSTLASKRAGLLPGTFERAQEISRQLQANGVNSFVGGPFNDTNVSCGQLAFVNRERVQDEPVSV
jgi:23S rRNA (adenine2503-C2)-methyltransferase